MLLDLVADPGLLFLGLRNTLTTIASPASTPRPSICDRYTGATRGSAGIDIPVADTVTILTRGICKVPLDAYGPIGQGLSAFLMGRSSSTIQGINVHLGLIDSDYVGQIQAMVSVSEPPVVIQKGTCIAQLVPFMSCVPTVVDRSRGTGGFGSTGSPQVLWTQKVTDERLVIQCLVTAKGCYSSFLSRLFHLRRSITCKDG